MNRREFLAGSGLMAVAASDRALGQKQMRPASSTGPLVQPPDKTIHIAPLTLELAPGKSIHTIAYNGSVPGPLLRWPEGKPFTVDVFNDTKSDEIVHWHGMWIPSEVDGAMEEGTPMVPPGASRRYSFIPRPAGMRWYHTHIRAGHDLKTGTYTGQFGFFLVDPKNGPGAYDQEIFLALHDWNAYMGGGGDASMDVTYDHASINDRILGAGEPLRVRQDQRVLFHILNASATVVHSIAFAAHSMNVVGLDGNAVANPAKIEILQLAPAERADVIVEMNQPGVWIMGEIDDGVRKKGMGIVIEYAGRQGSPEWKAPAAHRWDYTIFGHSDPVVEPDERIPLVFRQKFAGHGDFDHWTINGKSFPKTDTIPLKQGRRYRLMLDNQSLDDHPIHLHRHSFQLTSMNGAKTSGVVKDVVLVPANSKAEVDFVAANPGLTLFHCHQQSHMDFGFMMLFDYA